MLRSRAWVLQLEREPPAWLNLLVSGALNETLDSSQPATSPGFFSTLPLRGGTVRAPYLSSQRCFRLFSEIALFRHGGNLPSEAGGIGASQARARAPSLISGPTGRAQAQIPVTMNGHRGGADKCGTQSDELFCSILFFLKLLLLQLTVKLDYLAERLTHFSICVNKGLKHRKL